LGPSPLLHKYCYVIRLFSFRKKTSNNNNNDERRGEGNEAIINKKTNKKYAKVQISGAVNVLSGVARKLIPNIQVTSSSAEAKFGL
jgi:hypothetical protein